MNIKEEFISTVAQTMSIQLNPEQSEMLIYSLSTILQHYDLQTSTALPSVDVSDTQDLINRFIATKRIEGCQLRTLIQYKYFITRFSDVLQTDLKKVGTDTIRCFLGLMGKGNQNSYVDTIRRYLNSFFQWMEDEDIIVKNPCKKIKKIKTEKKMECPFSDTEMALIQDACSTQKEIAFIDLLCSTGCRREEITKIKISDIFWEDRSITIHGKGAKDRTVYMSARTILHLKSYIESRGFESDYLFAGDRAPHGRLSVESMHSYIKRIGKRAGVKNVHLHRFRKWFGTTMADKGVDIRDLKEMMGHESIETTNSYYIYSNLKRIKERHQLYAA